MHAKVYNEIVKSFPDANRLVPTSAILVWDSLLLTLWYLLIKTNDLLAVAVAQPLLTIVMFNAFALFHEAVHQNISKKYKSLNQLAGYMSSVFCLLPYSTWREDHLQHHRWSGNLEKDPVMKLLLAGKNGKLDHAWINVIWRSWLPIFAPIQIMLYWFSLATQVIRTHKSKHIISFVVPVTVWAAFFWLSSITFLQLLGSLVLYFFLSENINIPNHTGTDYIEGNTRLAPKDQTRTSQSCRFPTFFRLGVLMNFNLHAEHHVFPYLPWFQLPAASKALSQSCDANLKVCDGQGWLRLHRRMAIKDVICPPASSEIGLNTQDPSLASVRIKRIISQTPAMHPLRAGALVGKSSFRTRHP